MLEILHRDRQLAVLNKPAGLSLLADRSGAPCLWDRLPELLQARPLLVHRLDKGTSGVLLVALDAELQRRLTRAFQSRRVRKYYLAWVAGRLTATSTLEVGLPLRRGRKSRYRVAGPRERIRRTGRGWHLPPADRDPEGLDSYTRVRPLVYRDHRTLLLAAPRTGRSHQLRVHLSWIDHPILGDHLYGRPKAREQQAPRLQLHCHCLVVPGLGRFRAAPGAGWLDH